jgi:COX assembly protein 1
MMATPKAEAPRLPRNPLPLSASQESQVRELYYTRVKRKCADEIRGRLKTPVVKTLKLMERCPDFAACATNRTVTATWACRQQRLAMNSCMIAHASQQEQDAAREEWFATMDLRKKEREEKEKKKRESEKFFREWWDLDKKEGEKKKGDGER